MGTLSDESESSNQVNALMNDEVLVELTDMLGEKTIFKMLGVFQTEVKERIIALNELICTDENGYVAVDFNRIALEAHTLQSCAGSYGASALFKSVSQLEKHANEQDMNAVQVVFESVSDVGKLTIKYIDTIIANSPQK